MQRRYDIDQIKGLLILLVVLAHFLELTKLWETPIYGKIWEFIYAMHMPILILISGMFHKNKLLLSRISQIVILYALFQFLYFITTVDQPLTYEILYTPIWIMWFLLSLLFWNIITFFLDKIKYSIIIVLLCFFFIRLIELNGYPLSWMRTLYFLFFYYFGYKYSESFMKYFQLYKLQLLLTFFISAVLLYFITFTPAFLLGSYPYVATNQDLASFFAQELHVLTFSLSVFGCLLLLSRKFLSQHLIVLGQKTLSIYLIHGFIVIFITSLIKKHQALIHSNHILFIVLLIISWLTCYSIAKSPLDHYLKKWQYNLVKVLKTIKMNFY